ncbi:ornithine decarboxylase antizyme [Trichuris trichiura]|uniref:Ornithine decarboxylase antizyme n=1 Tax=Trichuris trichiura TaxID=36087 RepID=A0A077ZCS4_TRITR|nr:ornithine decarboxylase antizyme [Trichuris trichiura]
MTIVLKPAKDTSFTWFATVYSRMRVVLHAPPVAMAVNSKTCFINAVEFAQDCLGCTELYVDFSKSRPDCSTLIRTFSYFSFRLTSPGKAPFQTSEGFVVMTYSDL